MSSIFDRVETLGLRSELLQSIPYDTPDIWETINAVTKSRFCRYCL